VTNPRSWAKDLTYLAARALGPRVRPVRAILMYHDVGGPAGPSVATFAAQVRYLATHFRLLRIGEVPAALDGVDPVACVTFDDGYADAIASAMPVLSDAGVPATVFLPSGLLGSTIGTSYGPRNVIDLDGARALVAAGHEVGAHTVTHPRLTELPRAEASNEILGSREELASALGVEVDAFAYPRGLFDDDVVCMVREAGFGSAVTIREGLLRGTLDPLRLPRVAVGPTTTMTQFKAKLSGGLEAYERWRGRPSDVG
jgi:peptidoglycan/xylan/chitin deacetylase (PgdA/CDA1 family)